jgi:N-acetylmuramoyl-L-alanine amidase
MPRRTKHRRRSTRYRWWLVRTHLPAALLGGLVGAALVWVLLTRRSALTPLPTRPDPLTTHPQGYRWTDLPEPDFPVPPYARFLKDVTIVLDPGHVGQRDPGGTWKRGPTGLREAEVNLRVAQFLREFLVTAGARVSLTRDTDQSLNLPDKADLKQRSQVANETHADLLLSIHHNANGKPEPNYTSLFYHDSPAHGPASRCAARHLLAGLNDALRLTAHLECAVLDDELLYQNGLAVLREADVPAVLSEASFHSNPAEETRLRDPVYNRREAYGLFLGLARWAQAGLPRVRLVKITRDKPRGPAEAVLALDDGLSARGGWGAELPKVVPASIVTRLGGKPVRHSFDPKTGQVRVTLPSDRSGSYGMLFVDFENTLGQHVLRPQIPLSGQADAPAR